MAIRTEDISFTSRLESSRKSSNEFYESNISQSNLAGSDWSAEEDRSIYTSDILEIQEKKRGEEMGKTISVVEVCSNLIIEIFKGAVDRSNQQYSHRVQ